MKSVSQGSPVIEWLSQTHPAVLFLPLPQEIHFMRMQQDSGTLEITLFFISLKSNEI